MALDVAESLKDETNLMVEAGVGIGKSLAYLIPSLYTIDYSFGKSSIIIATSTISLSEQLMEDIKLAEDITDIKVNSELAKGMRNYVCRKKAKRNKRKYRKLKQRKVVDGNWERNLLKVPDWLWDWIETNSDRSNLPESVTDSSWSYVNIDRCKFHDCPWYSECDYYEIRNNIDDRGRADIIIVNQDLLLAHLLKKENQGRGFLDSNAEAIVIDEAHNLEEKTRNGLTNSLTKNNILNFLNQLIGTLSDSEEMIRSVKDTIILLFKQLEKQAEKNKQKRRREGIEIYRFSISSPDEVNFNKLIKELENLSLKLQVKDDLSGRKQDEFIGKLETIKKMMNGLSNMKESSYLLWGEKSYGEICISFAPKHINKKLRDMLFQSEIPVILTSATLCEPGNNTKEKYLYQKKALGFKKEAPFPEPKPSPFPYNENARLYIPNDLVAPHENREKYLNQISDRIKRLIKITHGRTLVLFTAKSDLNFVYKKFDSSDLSCNVLKQQSGSSQGSIISEFRETKGVILGSGVFWEGVDIKGSDLSSLIIARLPFPPPDAIIEYKISQVEDRFEILLPEMIMRLRQGAGRLIRSKEDKGILSILDSRISSKYDRSYKEKVINSLPINNKLDSLKEVNDFVSSNILTQY